MSAAVKTLLLLPFLALVALTSAASSTSSTDVSGSGSMSMTMSAAMPTDTSGPYTITALPQVTSQPSCIFNCLIPIGLADPSGCDDVTEECACLSAPADVLDVLTGCIQTVCKSSTSAYASIAASLYEGYCNSAFGTAEFTSAFSAESLAAASSSSIASVAATETTSSTSIATSPAASPSSTKSGSRSWKPSRFIVGLAIGGTIFIVVL